MINHDEKIYQEYIRALLFDTEQASLPRDQLSGKSEELANSLEYLGECVKEGQRILTQMADGDLSGSCDPNNHLAAQIKCIKNPTIQPRSIKCRLILRVLADWIFSIYIVTNFKFIHPVICLCEQLADRHDRFFIRSCTSKAEIAWIFNLLFHFFLKFQMSLFQPLPQRICRICFT